MHCENKNSRKIWSGGKGVKSNYIHFFIILIVLTAVLFTTINGSSESGDKSES